MVMAVAGPRCLARPLPSTNERRACGRLTNERPGISAMKYLPHLTAVKPWLGVTEHFIIVLNLNYNPPANIIATI